MEARGLDSFAKSVKEVRVFAATKYSDILVMLSMRALFRSITLRTRLF